MKTPILFFLFLLFFGAAIAQPDNEAALADQYFLDKEYDSALELYEKLYKKEAKELYVTRILTCFEQRKRYEDALVFLDKAVKRQPSMFMYLTSKASLLEKMGNIEQAELLYKEIIEKKLTVEGDFSQMASFLFKNGKYESAENCYLEGRKIFNIITTTEKPTKI
jgi:tetratricopeptide (TPR) repeat protein